MIVSNHSTRTTRHSSSNSNSGNSINNSTIKTVSSSSSQAAAVGSTAAETTAATTTVSPTAVIAPSADGTYQEYLRDANNVMQQYHTTRELMKQGKLGNNNTNNRSSSSSSTVYLQGTIAGLFVIAFMSMPFLGKKIATDDEFRKRYVPSWYDYTVPKPDKAWTRQELHEQMLDVQRTLHERAIAGEFTPENIERMRQQSTLLSSTSNSSISDSVDSSTVSTNNNINTGKSFDHLYPHRVESASNNPSNNATTKKNIPKDWDRIHPGLEDNEKVGED
jgi:hypothetical protein